MVILNIDDQDRTCDIDGTLKVSIGRRDVHATGDPSYCHTTLTTRTVEAGQLVTVDDQDVPRFTGECTDSVVTLRGDVQQLDDDVTAVGALANWGRARVGEEPWPLESVAERAQRIADVVGLPIVIEGGDTLEVVRVDVDRRTGIDLLRELADATGGWLFDDAAGLVHLQALDARKIQVVSATWAMEPAGQTWAALDDVTWADDDDPGPYQPIEIDACLITWQPQWRQELEIVNEVTVLYGEPTAAGVLSGSQTVADDESIARYGLIDLRLSTQLSKWTDAADLAAMILRRSAWPRWRMTGIELDLDTVGDLLALQLREALPGARVTITGLPAGSPMGAYPGILEGWEELWDDSRVEGDGRHTMTLFLSHIDDSLTLPTWAAEPVDATWADLAPDVTWESELT